eukprot:CAMPEP_0174255658 /NCGR_PEP_ID=MMETSP0439-20130205/4975_1 /TAXON_ID=0 /ORGANISM="Stereomyxa ramosa, Strain Chinc5" /LENGTH=302 /DNA_ID=CAMNT_0015337935 /DNA_START=492 /DNA_END=1400 /DNA_ORIENTATION=-
MGSGIICYKKHSFQAHSGNIQCIDASDDNIFTSATDGSFKVWDINRRLCKFCVKKHAQYFACHNQLGGDVVSLLGKLDRDTEVLQIMDLNRQAVISERYFAADSNRNERVRIKNDGNNTTAVVFDGDLYLVDVRSMETIHEIEITRSTQFDINRENQNLVFEYQGELRKINFRMPKTKLGFTDNLPGQFSFITTYGHSVLTAHNREIYQWDLMDRTLTRQLPTGNEAVETNTRFFIRGEPLNNIQNNASSLSCITCIDYVDGLVVASSTYGSQVWDFMSSKPSNTTHFEEYVKKNNLFYSEI